MPAIFAETALLPQGWAERVRIDWDAAGAITAVAAGAAPGSAERADALLPGMANLHCHAFQRAMAGLTERAGPEGDDFWSWREVMYRFLAALDPDQIEAIAAQLYVELLKGGYTAVAEFHYLHNDPAGRPYADRAELANRIIAAAAATGIRLTLLPVLYQTGNFGGAPASDGQRRFLMKTDAFNALVESLWKTHRGMSNLRVGIAPHSLRAVPPAALRAAKAALDRLDGAAPIHIHAAEQTKEVEDCLSWSKKRPVEWLLDEMRPDRRWTLIHCTHMAKEETQRLAASGAVAGLCPTTEADLGDGLFPLLDYLAANGKFGVGSDSNVGVVPAEELRWLEYGQRLNRRKRNLVPAAKGQSIGAKLWRAALAGGAQALAQPIGAIAPGCRADFLALDRSHPTLAGQRGDFVLDALVFAGASAAIRHVMVGGRWVVRDGRHPTEERIAENYRAALRRLA
ncbi:MAG TPA: formimidoylglutamate deiminase [Alphaproteobacteria bacterium]|jgi:formimidoylglutamate deiminase